MSFCSGVGVDVASIVDLSDSRCHVLARSETTTAATATMMIAAKTTEPPKIPYRKKPYHGSYGQRQKGPDACHANARQQDQLGHQQQYADDD